MTNEEIELTEEEQNKVINLDKLLLLACTNDEQTQQILNIMSKRIKQKEKLCAQPTTATHS